METASPFVSFQRHPLTGEIKMMNVSALTRGTDASLTTIDLAYRYVPWFRRACKLRANAIGRFPLELQNGSGDDVSEEPEYQAVMLWTRSMLYRIEMNLVKHGASYHLLESNRFGQNITPRFVPTALVYPLVDFTGGAGITEFQVSLIGGGGKFPLDQIVWVWEPNDESEIQPGSSDGEAALKASGVLYAIGEMTNRYMGSGGVPITAVRVPPSVSKEEREKTENFLTRFAGGFRNAFKFLVIDKGTEFERLGITLRELETDKLTSDERDNVAVAMGVPPTVIDGKAANFATAESEMTGYYINTVIPEAEMLEPILNTQLYQRMGITLRFKPNELEVMQAIQLEQAQSAQALAGGKELISVNEGRSLVDFESIGPAGDWPTETTPTTTPEFAPPTETPPTDITPPEATMRAWLKISLDRIKGGSPATVGAPFDSELSAAKSGNDVRRIYESHWPRKSSAPTLNERAIAALENYNALAIQESKHGSQSNVHLRGLDGQ